VHRVDAVAGAFMLVRRAAGQALGWWDEDFFFYGEDLDLCFRLQKAGWSVYFVPDVAITHFKGMASGIKKVSKSDTQADIATQLVATHSRFEAMRIFYRKHYSKCYPRPVEWAVMAGIRLKESLTLRGVHRQP
jgi:GT2 family glycosyltransferase